MWNSRSAAEKARRSAPARAHRGKRCAHRRDVRFGPVLGRGCRGGGLHGAPELSEMHDQLAVQAKPHAPAEHVWIEPVPVFRGENMSADPALRRDEPFGDERLGHFPHQHARSAEALLELLRGGYPAAGREAARQDLRPERRHDLVVAGRSRAAHGTKLRHRQSLLPWPNGSWRTAVFK